jgi:hypothetical protein
MRKRLNLEQMPKRRVIPQTALGGDAMDSENGNRDQVKTVVILADRRSINYASLIRTFERLQTELEDISQSLKAEDTAKD